MTRYISDGTWFKYGTECQCINCWQMGDGEWVGIFKGIRICENPKSERREYGEEYINEELCSFDEFYIIDEYQQWIDKKLKDKFFG